MLDLKPDGIHARCPIILGSPTDVQTVLEIYAKHSDEAAAAVAAAAATAGKVKELA